MPVRAGDARRLTRRSLALGSAAAAASLAVACAPSDSQSAAGQPAAKAPVKLAYMSPHQPGTAGFQKDEEQFRLFSQAYPHITVELSPIAGWAAVKEKLIVQASGGTPIQLTQNGWGLWMDLARGGIIRELSSFFKADKLSPENLFLPVAAEFLSHRGTLYSFPVSISSDQFPFNKDLFDQESLPYPPQDRHDTAWTMERFLEVTQKLTKPGQQVGMANVHSPAYLFNRGTWYGHITWDESKRQVTVNHPLMIKGIQFWVDLVHRYRIVPGAQEIAALGGGNLFLTGKAAMQYTCCPLGLKDASFRWGLATLPYSGPAGSKHVSGRIFPHALLLAKNLPVAEHEAAWTLFKWYTSKPEYGGLMPPSNSHVIAPYKDARFSDLALKDFEQQTGGVSARASLLTAQTAPLESCGLKKYIEYDALWARATADWDAVQAGQTSAQDFVQTLQRACDDAKFGTADI
jgi:ABC-type glycerol-3-phosphate transport system substrate-binding protein